MKDGRIGHAELALGDNVVMLASVFQEMDQTTPEQAVKSGGGWYSQVFCYVADVDAHHARPGPRAPGSPPSRPTRPRRRPGRPWLDLRPAGPRRAGTEIRAMMEGM